MKKNYVLGIDEGTTSERVVLYDIHKREIVDVASVPIECRFPKDGYVEQDARYIAENAKIMLEKVIKRNKLQEKDILGLAITNQRETVVAWDNAGEPALPAIVWQCRRTAQFCKNVSEKDKVWLKNKTGLIMDAYFSASKMRWIIQNSKKAQELAGRGELHMGTIDSYLLYCLSEGKIFATDTSNVSRTMLVDLKTIASGRFEYDKKLLEYFGIQRNWLPNIVNSAENMGTITIAGIKISVLSMVGDQEGSLIGQGCVYKGDAKNTYGTGCFFMQNVSDDIDTGMKVKNLLTTVGWSYRGKTQFALEGSIFHAGSIANWLVDKMKLVANVGEIEGKCLAVKDNGGVYLIPAFTGIGAPYWDGFARAKFTGITLATTSEHLVRASMESICYLSADIIQEAENSGLSIHTIVCDGGVSKNGFVMQFQSDILGKKIYKSYESESTVMGAIYLAMLAGGVIKNVGEVKNILKEPKEYVPKMMKTEKLRNLNGWQETLRSNGIVKP